MDKPRPKSRFSFQQGAYGSVAPPSQNSNTRLPVHTTPAALSVQPQKVRDYFDDDDDEGAPTTSSAPTNKDDDYDPLDDFM
jgi:hypothetical protein